MGLAFQISSLIYMIPLGLGSAANTRVANELGAGRPATAAAVVRVALTAVFVQQLLLAAAAYTARAQLVAAFTHQPAVMALALRVVPILTLAFMGDGLNTVLSGVLRGAGRQMVGAAVNLAGYWCGGVPLAALLGFHFGMGVFGFWGGLVAASSAQAVAQIMVVMRLDWRHEVRRAHSLVHSQSEALLLADAARAAAGGADGDGAAAADSSMAASSRSNGADTGRAGGRDVEEAATAAAAAAEDEGGAGGERQPLLPLVHPKRKPWAVVGGGG